MACRLQQFWEDWRVQESFWLIWSAQMDIQTSSKTSGFPWPHHKKWCFITKIYQRGFESVHVYVHLHILPIHKVWSRGLSVVTSLMHQYVWQNMEYQHNDIHCCVCHQRSPHEELLKTCRWTPLSWVYVSWTMNIFNFQAFSALPSFSGQSYLQYMSTVHYVTNSRTRDSSGQLEPHEAATSHCASHVWKCKYVLHYVLYHIGMMYHSRAKVIKHHTEELHHMLASKPHFHQGRLVSDMNLLSISLHSPYELWLPLHAMFAAVPVFQLYFYLGQASHQMDHNSCDLSTLPQAAVS